MSSAVKAAAPRASRPFRILALPLARLPRALPPHPPSSASTPPTVPDSAPSTSPYPASSSTSNNAASTKSTSTPLMLFHVVQPDPSAESGPPSYTQRALDKASDIWYKLGDKDPKSVLYWFYKKGEGLMDKIEYEEWALKAIHEGQGVKIAEKGKEAEQQKIEIPLLKPTFEDQPLPTLIPKLHRFLIHRIPYHRKMMMRSIIASPLTWPFAIIPILPNFPLFYVLWRAWSHYKAWRGAMYLEQLLKLGMIVEKPSKELDAIYKAKGVVLASPGSENKASDSTASQGVTSTSSSGEKVETVNAAADDLVKQAKGESPGAPDGTATPESMVFNGKKEPSSTSSSTTSSAPAPRHPSVLLGTNQIPILAKQFDLRPLEILDVTRAVEQAGLRAKKIDQANTSKDADKA